MGNLIMPGRGVNMGDGWETKKTAAPGNRDWVILRLARGSSAIYTGGYLPLQGQCIPTGVLSISCNSSDEAVTSGQVAWTRSSRKANSARMQNIL